MRKGHRHGVLFFFLLFLLAASSVGSNCEPSAQQRPVPQSNSETAPRGPEGGELSTVPGRGDPESPHLQGDAVAQSVRLTVLFFNDLHGHLLPFPVKQEDGTKKEMGGIARLAGLVRQIRTEREKEGAKTVVLVAGDILQGTPMSTVFRGRPDVEALNALGVDAMTVGNHEFDFGLENFLELKHLARFPFLSVNIVERKSGKNLCPGFISFPLASGLSLTVIGVTTADLLWTTSPENVAELSVTEPVEAVRAVYEKVKDEGPVIVLSHSKAATDEAIARALPELAAIIGGHDQILLNPRKLVGMVPVFQAFEKGKYLGRLDLVIDGGGKKAEVENWTYLPITAELPVDPEVEGIVESYRAQLDARFREVIGESRVFLDGERERIRYEETNLGNFITDIMRIHTQTEIALLNAGSLRASIDVGPIRLEDVFKVMPYENELVRIELTGAEVMAVLTRAVMGRREDEDGGFLHVSGLKFQIRDRKPEKVMAGDTPLELEKTYTAAITDFMASGGDGYQIFIGKPFSKTRLPLRELMVETIRQRGVISAEKEGRIVRLEE